MSRFGCAVAALVLPLSVVLTACGGADESVPADSSNPAPAQRSPEGNPVASPPTGSEGSVSNGFVASDLCDLLQDSDVATVLGDSATVSTTASFGGLSDETGGQCVWTDDPAGDAYSATATNLELVAFVPDGLNPPPAEAPAVGSSDVRSDATGVYFATRERVFWLRVTGSGSATESVVGSARALVDTIKGRVRS